MKYVSIDIETTGLDPDMHDIIEFGAIFDDLDDDNPEYKTFHCYFNPQQAGGNFVGSPYALSMHADKFLKIASRGPDDMVINPWDLGNTFMHWIINVCGYKHEANNKAKIIAAGKNFGSFDLQFLKLKTNLLQFIDIHYRMIDPCILYYQPGDTMLPSMDECLKRAGIEKKVTHNAVDDAMDIVRLIRHKMRS